MSQIRRAKSLSQIHQSKKSSNQVHSQVVIYYRNDTQLELNIQVPEQNTHQPKEHPQQKKQSASLRRSSYYMYDSQSSESSGQQSQVSNQQKPQATQLHQAIEFPQKPNQLQHKQVLSQKLNRNPSVAEEIAHKKVNEYSNKSVASEISQDKHEKQSVSNKSIEGKHQCQICYLKYQQDKIERMFSCQEHWFCIDCLTRYTKDEINNYRIPKCPNCGAAVNKQSTIFTQLDQKTKLKYEKIMFEKQTLEKPNQKLCPSPQCELKGVIHIAPDNRSKGKCDNCKVVYCLDCMMKEHRGKCAKTHATFLKDTYKYQRCKKCRNIVERHDGCPHMTCLCGHQFCYGCGKKWNYSHNCWRNRLGNSKTVFQKIDDLLKCLNADDDTNWGQFKHIISKTLFAILVFLWFLWCTIFAIITYSLVLILCLSFGYFGLLCVVCKESRSNCLSRICILLVILFAPVVYPFAGLVFFIMFIKQKTCSFLIDPSLKGQKFPIFRCKLQ